MLKKNGFTLIEALIVVAVVALLAALATPGYLQHTRRARASEAIATMSMIRQSLRDYAIYHNGDYYDVGGGNVGNTLPTSVSSGVPAPSTAGVEVDVGIAQYFSTAAFSVDATSPSSTRFTSPGPVDFIISVNGGNSVACGTSDCALHNTAVSAFRVEMDNTARVFISYDSGTNWSEY